MEKTRGYSVWTIKAVDEEKRQITGFATTPDTDRMGDIVMPEGATFKLPFPLLWQHDALQPIGQVIQAKVTKAGIEIVAQLVKVDGPSQLAARLEEAWVSIKTGLVRGLSIGFRPLEWAWNDNDGITFNKWEMFETSAVTIAANVEASITSIKSFDTEARKAALGNKTDDVQKKKPSGDTEKKKNTVKLLSKDKLTMKLGDQIKDFQATRSAKAAEMESLLEKSATSGETLDEADSETFETLEKEIVEIDKHLKRLKSVQANQVSNAKAVDEDAGQDEGATHSQTKQFSTVRSNQKKLPGLAMAQVVKCIGIAKGNLMAAAQIADSMYKDDNRIGNVLKAAVSAGTTTNTTWAGNLVSAEGGVYADFVEFLRPQTILGKFGTGNIPALRSVPFRVPLLGQTSGGSGFWVGEGKGKPLTKFDFSRTHLDPLKVANIAVVTEELLRDSSPSADVLVRDQLVEALRARLDTDFIDPNKALSAGVSPASITNGVTPVVSSGSTADDVRCDIANLLGTYIAANNTPVGGVLIMASTTALAISLMRNALGQKEFPDINFVTGGSLEGIPVIVSQYVASDIVVMVNAPDVYIGDEGGFAVDMSREASLEMSDAPTQHADPTAAGSSMVSMFQTNCVAFRAERTMNWAKRRAGAVAYLSSVDYNTCPVS